MAFYFESVASKMSAELNLMAFLLGKLENALCAEQDVNAVFERGLKGSLTVWSVVK